MSIFWIYCCIFELSSSLALKWYPTRSGLEKEKFSLFGIAVGSRHMIVTFDPTTTRKRYTATTVAAMKSATPKNPVNRIWIHPKATILIHRKGHLGPKPQDSDIWPHTHREALNCNDSSINEICDPENPRIPDMKWSWSSNTEILQRSIGSGTMGQWPLAPLLLGNVAQ